MENIKCKHCGEVRPESEYYRASLSKCKECIKKATREAQALKRQDPDWVEKEKERTREKYHRLNYRERHKPDPESKKRAIKRYKDKFPEKINARNKSSHLQCKVEGNHLHHWSYNPEHVTDVIELTKVEHYYLHRHIIYDQERVMYRRHDNNVLLDSREAHEKYIKELFTINFK